MHQKHQPCADEIQRLLIYNYSEQHHIKKCTDICHERTGQPLRIFYRMFNYIKSILQKL